MTKTLVICDSFKGSMTSKEVSRVIQSTLDHNKYQSDVIVISDGGEGFLDALTCVRNDLTVHKCRSFDALRRENDSHYLVSKDTLYFELADCVGIKDLSLDELDVFNASTFGLGFLIKKAILSHPNTKEVVIGIGGSASNDAGTGLLEAMGVKFKDKDNNLITQMCNAKLSSIDSLELDEFNKLIKGIKFKVLTDVTNPLLGENGATYVYSKQKGALKSDFIKLENNLRSFHNLCENIFEIDHSHICGAGAAGGVGYGMLSFFNAQLVSGIDTILEMHNFKNIISEYDLIISGEGRLDNQSLQGKVISGITKYNPKRLELIVGSCALENCDYKVYPIVPTVATLEESLANPQECLKKLINKIYN